MHILVVEDEQRLARLLQRVLTEERHTAEVALTGTDGLYLAQTVADPGGQTGGQQPQGATPVGTPTGGLAGGQPSGGGGAPTGGGPSGRGGPRP